jgi:hypothetical protein
MVPESFKRQLIAGPDRQSEMLRSILTLLSIVLGLALTALLLLSLLRIPIDLSPYRPMIESGASKTLGRAVKVDGDITVTTSL